MANDIKSGIGYIIPAAAVVGFFTTLLLGEYLLSIVIAVAGILVWFVYMLVMESSPPSNLGNLIMLFGMLLSLGIFMGFGIAQNMWGGIEFQTEGSLFALVILFFSILTGMLFRNQPFAQPVTSVGNLTEREKKWVQKALKQSDKQADDVEPKVIVMKQEPVEKDLETEDSSANEETTPYNNPYMYAYPPEYYYDNEYDEDDYDDDDEDE